MDFVDVQSSDTAIIKSCVSLASLTANDYADDFGSTANEINTTTKKIADKISAGVVRLSYAEHYQGISTNGEVAVFFHWMKWLTLHQNSATPLGTVWSVSVVFDPDTVFPVASNNATDQQYIDFLDYLNLDNGPTRTFLTANRLTTLYIVGSPTDNPANNDNGKHISRLERVATTWQPTGKMCKMGNKYSFYSNYMDFNGDPIPANILQHWGSHWNNTFAVTEVGYTF